MTDYKHTLNLPTTDFPMKANLPKNEPLRLHEWEVLAIYDRLRIERKDAPKFIVHDGPPYTNGDIHLGHVINKTLKDFVVKSKTLSGFDAPFIPGWDCHGLPIEIKVEKQVGKAGVQLTAEAFREACKRYAETELNRQRESFKRLGVFANWSFPYTTMDPKYEAEVLRALARVIEGGHVHRGAKSVYWCIDCGSALAEAEVEYREKRSVAIDIRFRVLNKEQVLLRFANKVAIDNRYPLSIPVWTTTPWTLPANQAVALNAHFIYALVQCTSSLGVEYLIVAEVLLKDTMLRSEIEDYRVLAQIEGAKLEGILVEHPFYERQVPVVLSDHVTNDAGTGAVHIAPGHGLEDYVVGKRYGLSIEHSVGGDGRFLAGTNLLGGKTLIEANELIVEFLKAKGNLLKKSAITHSYPHCWRHKTPLIFRATPQWFISMDAKHLRERALEAVQKIRWIPDWGKERIELMIAGRPDWCISRQRHWGVPITAFIHKETKVLHPKTVPLMLEIASLVAEKGLEAWYQSTPADWLDVSEADSYEKVTDILDVWFESGVSHAGVLKIREEACYPADLYLEGTDQYRGWFQSSIITACALNLSAQMEEEPPPCRTVVTHGYVIDAEGLKMSKSLGNVIAPSEITSKWGADILRLWASSCDYTREINLSEEILMRLIDSYRRIRNTARFLLANICDFDPGKHLVPRKNMLSLDRFAVDIAARLQEEIRAAYDNYQFHVIYQKIHHFCSVDMGSFYLDIIKDRVYTTKTDALPRRSAQTALYLILEALVRWMAPILSFTADEIWQYMPKPRENSVFLTTWFTSLFMLPESEKMNREYWELMMQVRDEVNLAIERLRIEGHLGSSLEAEVVLYADANLKAKLDLLADELRFVLITSDAKVETLDGVNAKETKLSSLKLAIKTSAHKKCIRCWHRRADVGEDPEHPLICGRCVENIKNGEERHFA